MDKGVSKNYIERNFKGIDDDLKWRRDRLNDRAKRRFYDDKAAFYAAQKKTTLEEFQMVQESRPLKPLSRRKS